jgi:hypothetical protein
MENPENYKEGGQVGFCFGRALYLHYLLLKSGVPQNELAKIFVLGELKFGDTFWRFHVALMVRDKAQGFLVVDPLVGEVIGYREWMEKNAAYDVKAPNGRSRFYVTDARKFMPAFGEYDAAQLKEPVLRKYFEGLVQSL